MRNDKVILTDCDGVILDWEYSFSQWMARHGYQPVDTTQYSIDKRFGMDRPFSKTLVRMFNESAAIRRVPPLRDAIKYIKKLHEEHGFVFHAITSLSNDQYAQHLRTKNLIELFGPTAFEKYTYLDCGADKDEALLPYKDSGCLWVEDKVANAECGLRMGLNSILVSHNYNSNTDSRIPRVQNWKEIYDMMTS